MQLKTAADGVPGEVLRALRAAESELVNAPSPSEVVGSRAEWAEVVSTAQRVINAATAVQDEAIVAVCAIEDEILEDGTVVEGHRAPGHVALDGSALVAGALSVAGRHAEQRVRSAVRLAADGPAGSDTATGLAGLHTAMRSGDLDAYRAGVVAEELEEAPAEVAEAVVGALAGHWSGDTGPRLRGRCRTVLSRISPDLLRQRATKARQQCSLRRWAEEPGVDTWEGTFPSEDAARAWAAIDARAQQLRADGTCDRIERARAQALIDLVTGSATITTVLTVTVPAAAVDSDDEAAPTDSAEAAATGTTADTAPVSPAGTTAEAPHATGNASSMTSANDLVQVTVSGIAQPVFVTREFLVMVGRAVKSQTVTTACHPATGALLGSGGSSAYRPPAAMVALVKQRDGRCRFPGCHVAARFCDLDHVRPWPAGPTDPSNLICLCRRHHRIKQRLGWTVRLAVDGTCTWTDPTGRVRTTSAIDSLHTMVLPAPAAHSARDPLSETGSRTSYDLLGTMSDQHSGLEFVLEHHAAAINTGDLTRADALRTASLRATGRRTRLAMDVHRPHVHRPGADRFVLAPSWPGAPGHQTSKRCRRPDHAGQGDDPPF